MANKSPPRRSGARHPRHRLTKFTEEQLAKALRMAGGSHAQACRILLNAHGFTVARSTMGRLVASSTRLKRIRDEARNARLDYAESQLWRRVQAGNWQALKFFLMSKGAERGYVMPSRRKIVPPKPVRERSVFDFSGLSAEQLKELNETLAAARMRAAAPPEDIDDDEL